MNLQITVPLFRFVFVVLGVVHTAVSSTTAAMESIDVTNGCPNFNWTADNRSCYLYMQEKIDFYKANESCDTLGANLVSISGAEENQFIREYVGDSDLPVWIGLYRTNNETCLGAACRNWMWLDGSEAVYTQWAMAFASPGQCVHMIVQGTWGHNFPCSTQYGYVCEKIRIFQTTTSELTTILSASEMTFLSDPAVNVASTTDSSRKNDEGINMPLIIACVIGGLLVSGIIIGAVVVLVKRHRNASHTDQSTRDMDRKSPKRDSSKRTGERISSQPDQQENKQERKSQQKDKTRKVKDKKSSTKDHQKNHSNDDTPLEGANGINLGYCHEDVELGSTTSAHGGGFNQEPVYAEPIKKKHRPRSEGVKVHENSLYASGK